MAPRYITSDVRIAILELNFNQSCSNCLAVGARIPHQERRQGCEERLSGGGCPR